MDKGFFYTYFSSYHGKRLFNGISGYILLLYERSKGIVKKIHIYFLQKILITPWDHSAFLLKGEGFEKLIKLPSLKEGGKLC